jgi:hypothetical protein
MPQDREIKKIKQAVYRAAHTEARKAELRKKDREYAATPAAKARRKAARDIPQKVLPNGACNTSMFAELIGMNLYEARLILKIDNIDFPEAMEKVRYRSTIYLMTDVVAWIASHTEWLEAREVRPIRVYKYTPKSLSFYENSIKFKDIFAGKYAPKALTMNKLANKVSILAVTTRVSVIGVFP